MNEKKLILRKRRLVTSKLINDDINVVFKNHALQIIAKYKIDFYLFITLTKGRFENLYVTVYICVNKWTVTSYILFLN